MTSARLLVVHHTPSMAVAEMLEAIESGARHPELAEVDVAVEPALSATVSDLLAADALVLLTPANIGYMSGALKHFFDTVYYPCLEDTPGRPYGLFVHGNDDTTGAIRDIERIVTGLAWRTVAAPVRAIGAPLQADLDACWELGATVAASLDG